MNYLIFRSIVDTMVTNFKCQRCGSSIEPQNIGIQNISSQGIHLEVICPRCQHTIRMNAEVNQASSHIRDTEQGRAFMEEISQKYGVEPELGEVTASIQVISEGTPTTHSHTSITDADIMMMHTEMKGKNITVSDIIQ